MNIRNSIYGQKYQLRNETELLKIKKINESWSTLLHEGQQHIQINSFNKTMYASFKCFPRLNLEFKTLLYNLSNWKRTNLCVPDLFEFLTSVQLLKQYCARQCLHFATNFLWLIANCMQRLMDFGRWSAVLRECEKCRKCNDKLTILHIDDKKVNLFYQFQITDSPYVFKNTGQTKIKKNMNIQIIKDQENIYLKFSSVEEKAI